MSGRAARASKVKTLRYSPDALMSKAMGTPRTTDRRSLAHDYKAARRIRRVWAKYADVLRETPLPTD